MLHERSIDRQRSQHERPHGDRHQVAVDGHRHRFASRRLVGGPIALGGLRRLDLQGQGRGRQALLVHDGTVELLDAAEVWGKGVHDTVKFFKEKYGAKDLSVITIGQAGEHLVKFACWMNEDDRASGRGGTGCVGGSKNLKAVVIKAEKKLVKAADRDKWKAAHQKALAEIMDERVVTSPRKGGLSVYGTNVLTNMTNVIGAYPTKNSQFMAYGGIKPNY